MWFKNLIVYRLSGWDLGAEQLEQALARLAFQGCGALDMESRGWVGAAGEGEPLVHALKGQLLIALGVEQKLLPASVVNDHARARGQEIEARLGYRPGRKQMREIKERVIEELLPRAFARRRATRAWIDPVGGWLVVDAANVARADDLLELLRRSLDDLPLSTLQTRLAPAAAMTGWLAAHEAPGGFSIDRDCELIEPGADKATVRYLRHSLESKQVRSHIQDGKQVSRLALTWNDRVSFVLHENLQVKRVEFLDLLKERAEQQAESAAEQFDADFALMTGELGRMLPDLVAALGGEVEAA